MIQPYQHINSTLQVLLFGVTIAITPVAAQADSAAEKGFEIARAINNSDNGFGVSIASAKMILSNKAGQSTTRKMQFLTLERVSETVGDKSISIFSTPADIMGTAVLSHAKIKGDDSQWIYLPAAKRVKRIPSSNKSGPFMGSEFSYEDITAEELGKFTYKWVKSEACGSAKCDVIERAPTYKHSGYSHQSVWINSKTKQSEKVQFFDQAKNHVKTLTFSDYKKYD
ncbi:MAG: outer membrane lipoprotein-sorting protein [Paracoccaceae bacterium]|nr:outer membrane lipoprotein-sorting protein [Paracoccaceae bacterium]